MFKRAQHIIFVPVILALFILVSFPWNAWFSETMPRHQLLQLPAMLGLAVISGVYFSKLFIKELYWGIAVLIFIMSSIIFWMLPHSIDWAVINTSFNRVMHINMFVAGFLLILVLRNNIFEIKIVFFGMLSAMILVSGITLKAFNILLCSSFNIEQQKETGFYLIIIGFVLFVSTVFVFIRGLGMDGDKTNDQTEDFY